MATSKIAQHHHCRSCGKAFVGDDAFCSTECGDTNQAVIKRKKKQLLFLYTISFIVLIVAIVFMGL
jgi:predicted nucleic acid-binding Zn ribbon protein